MSLAEPGINAWSTKIHLSASAGEILVEGGVLAGQADRGAHGAGVAYDVVAERRAAGTVRACSQTASAFVDEFCLLGGDVVGERERRRLG